jgi:hypothetical protein
LASGKAAKKTELLANQVPVTSGLKKGRQKHGQRAFLFVYLQMSELNDISLPQYPCLCK